MLSQWLLQSSLEDVVMEEGVKTMVSDEIKRFRQSYQVCLRLCEGCESGRG